MAQDYKGDKTDKTPKVQVSKDSMGTSPSPTPLDYDEAGSSSDSGNE